MATIPSGVFAVQLLNLKNLIANGSNFQTWTGAANSTAAKAFIHYFDAPAATTGNFCEIWPGEDWSLRRNSELYFSDAGTVAVMFRSDIADADEPETELADAALTFMNSIGGIVDDMMNDADTSGLMVLQEINLDFGPQRSWPQEGESNAYFECAFIVSYGLEE